jgi:hypothetical protein
MCRKVMQGLYFSEGSLEKRKLHTMEINSGFLKVFERRIRFSQLIFGTPTKPPAPKDPASKGQATKGSEYERSWILKVRMQRVRKKMSGEGNKA